MCIRDRATELSKLQEIIEGLKVQQNISLEKVAPFMHAPTWRQRWEDNYPDLKQELTTAAQKWQTKTPVSYTHLDVYKRQKPNR